MWIKMLTMLFTLDGPFYGGEVYDIADAIGACWVRHGLASISTIPPTFLSDFYARLEDGAGKPCLFLPFLGEFGFNVMYHLRFVHFHKASRKAVCCRPGEQVLFPSADEFITDWTDPIADGIRTGTMKSTPALWPSLIARFPDLHPVSAGCLGRTQEHTALYPDRFIPFRPKLRGLKVDVCIGTRKRDLAPEKNWKHWQHVADTLTSRGYSFAVIGAKTSAPDLAGQTYHSGDLDTDAAIELMQNCRLYVGSDSGNTHLAATVGARVIVFREFELTSGSGYIDRMQGINPGRVEYLADSLNAWDRPEVVEHAALAALRDEPGSGGGGEL